jgi:hypothetical protein
MKEFAFASVNVIVQKDIAVHFNYCNAINWRELDFTSDNLWDINVQVA